MRGQALGGEAHDRATAFGAVVWRWRANEQLTRSSAAHRLGVTPDLYAKIEDNLVDPVELAPSTALRIQHQAGLSPADLGIAANDRRPQAASAVPVVGIDRAGAVTLIVGGHAAQFSPDDARLLAASLVRHADLAGE